MTRMKVNPSVVTSYLADDKWSGKTEPRAAMLHGRESAMRSLLHLCRSGLVSTVLVALFASLGTTQEHSKYKTLTNAQVREMLDKIEVDIKEQYYDPQLHGLDLDKRFESAREKIAAAQSQNEALLHVAGAVAALNDSHTRFLPPPAPYGVEYGWRMQAVGDSNCYVTRVRSESDAATKGLKPGDQVESVNGVTLTRQDLSYIEYGYWVIPQSGLHLVVRSADGSHKTIVAMAKILPGQPLVSRNDVLSWRRHQVPERDRSRYHREADVLFWQLPDFLMQPEEVEESLNKTRSVGSVVLDLRGNLGGNVTTLIKVVGGFFAHDVRIGDRKMRKDSEPQIAKTRGGKAFGGKLIVLVDSRSSSAAEIFARVVQLEKRGIVLGDRSAGAVTEAHFFPHAVSLSPTTISHYGDEITVAALIMTDGGMLENVGVTPDERILPTPADIAEGRDPVLARAAELVGLKMTAQEAGKMFPFEWPKEQMPQID
jgi:C-terminal processing protease CtpA/Prc